MHSERELRIVAPNTGNAAADEAAAVAIEFGVLRGLLDLNAPAAHRNRGGSGAGRRHWKGGAADLSEWDFLISRVMAWVKKWWPFCVLVIAGGLGVLRAEWGGLWRRGDAGRERDAGLGENPQAEACATECRCHFCGLDFSAILPEIAEEAAQGQFATGEGIKITDGTNFVVVDPCKAHTKLFASISQTGNTQLVAGTAWQENLCVLDSCGGGCGD